MNVSDLRKTRLAGCLRKIANLCLVDRRRAHELVEPVHLRRLLRSLEVDCVFDIGANAGQYATMLRHQAGYRGWIVSFEPLPAMANKLKGLLAKDDKWLFEPIAVSDKTGTAKFQVMHESQFSSLSSPRHDEYQSFIDLNRVVQSVEVNTETLDHAFVRLREKIGFKKAFLKMDTQGFDTTIVQASQIAIQHFVGLQSELAIKKIYTSSVDYHAALALYESKGFELSALVPNNAGHFPKLVEIDCIMIRGR